jgi:hypothetical protein
LISNIFFLYLIILPIVDINVLFFLFFLKKTKKQKNKFAGEPGQKQKKNDFGRSHDIEQGDDYFNTM